MEYLQKTPSGIDGLDEITSGGFPTGRPILVCGSAGAGKTLLAMQFLLCGAIRYHEPGVLMTFEETAEELAQNVNSLGFDLKKLVAQKKIVIDHVHIERSEIEETGEFNLEGLFVRLDLAVKSIGAKRVVLDTLEALFAGLPNEDVLRSELRRLFRWLKEKGLTAVITAEAGKNTLTRHGLEEYVADCVIALDHRVAEQVSTRRLRVVKYRGTTHGTNEYPFLINRDGISVLPVTSMGLKHKVSNQRISSGVPRLDTMLEGKGYYRGSSILVSGTAGTGKSSLAAAFCNAACKRGERCLYFAFEESVEQINRNMRSIGINLQPWVKKGLLRFHAARPTLYGLEMHLVTMHDEVKDFKPSVVVVDPVTNLTSVSNTLETHSMLTRLIDFLKTDQITSMFTSLTSASDALEQTGVGISSLMDTWLVLRDIELQGERNRGLTILKSRGMAHSNQVREFLLTNRGIELEDVYIGGGDVLTGSARRDQLTRDKTETVRNREEVQRQRRELQRKGKAIQAQIAALQMELKNAEDELNRKVRQDDAHEKAVTESRRQMASRRMADTDHKGEK